MRRFSFSSLRCRLVILVLLEVAFADVSRTLARNLLALGLVTFLVVVVAWLGSEVFLLRGVRALVGATQGKIDIHLPYAAASVRLINKENGLLEPVVCRNLDENEWKLGRGKSGRGLANAVLEGGVPVTIKNAQADQRVNDTEFYRRHSLTSYLGVPLIAQEKVLGVLGFYTKEEHRFSNEEIAFLTTLAGQAAIAIYHSRLYEQTKKQATELEKAKLIGGIVEVDSEPGEGSTFTVTIPCGGSREMKPKPLQT